MSAHTPGPWHACCATTEAHYVFAEDGETTICQPYHNDPALPEYDSACGIVTKEQRLANAHLIAAAPELLEALEFALHANYSNLMDMKFKAAAAIAKAKGETRP